MENWEELPQEVQDILFSCQEEVDYEVCKDIVNQLEQIGWTADYDLSAQIFNVKKK